MKNRSKPLNLSKLIFVNLLDLFNFRVKKQNYFPQKIGKFNFEKTLKNPTRGTTLGIYSYRKQKVIVKTYQGSLKTFKYRILKNEVEVSKVLNQARQRLINKIPAELKDIKIPKTIFVKESTNKLYVGFDYINSVTLKSRPIKERLSTYFKVIKFLKFLGENMTANEKNKLSRREPLTLIKLYPLMVMKSSITHPATVAKLLKGIPIFYKMSNLIKKLEVVLSHRDLHFENILVSKYGIYIIDLEFTLFGPEIFDEMTTLRHEWSDYKLRIMILKKMISKYRFYNNLPEILKVISIGIATHSLTANNFPAGLKKNYINLLDYALKPKAFKERIINK